MLEKGNAKMKKILVSAVIIISAFVFTFASPAFSEEKITGKLLGIKLTIIKSDGKEELVDVTKAHKIRTGDRIAIHEGKAEKDRKGNELRDIELFYTDSSKKEVSTHVKKVGKIKIGDKIVIKDGFAKQKGGRGC